MNVFLPLEITIGSDEIILAAGGETIRFCGKAYAFDADAPLETALHIERREFVTLSLDARAQRASFVNRMIWFAGEWDADSKQEICATGL